MIKKGFLVLLLTVFLISCTGGKEPAIAGGESVDACPFKLPYPNSLGAITVSQGNFEGNHVGNLSYADDFDGEKGDPILAAASGLVAKVHDGETACGGEEFINNANYVVIQHLDQNGKPVYTTYLHLQPGILVVEGQKVQQGTLLGYMGNTGWTNCNDPNKSPGGGYHLHFQLQAVADRIGQSIPVCFEEVPGGFPVSGKSYVSQNQLVQVLGAQAESYTENIGPTQEVTKGDLRDAILGNWVGEVTGSSENTPTYVATRQVLMREGCHIAGLAYSNLCLLISWDFPESEYFAYDMQGQSTFCFVPDPWASPEYSEAYKFCFTPKGETLYYEAQGPLASESGTLYRVTSLEKELDLSTPTSIAMWTAETIAKSDYMSLSQLVGSEGSIFAGYGIDFNPPGYNNGEEFAKSLGLALADSHPVCLGYRLEGDSNNKLYIVFSNANLKEQVTGRQHKSDITLFLFFKNGGQYELEVVVPVDNNAGWEIDYETSNLTSCQ